MYTLRSITCIQVLVYVACNELEPLWWFFNDAVMVCEAVMVCDFYGFFQKFASRNLLSGMCGGLVTNSKNSFLEP